MDAKVKEWSTKRLQFCVKDSITKMFEGVLDFAEVAVGEEKRYRALRSKVLRLANDAIRSINSEIESSYYVEYTEIGEDIVKIKLRKGEVK